jgi:xylulokinase
MKRRAALLALDLGTTSIKALLVDPESGAPLAFARRPAGATSMTSDGGVEGDQRHWWAATTDAISAVMRAATIESSIEIRAITAVGHGPSLFPMRSNGQPTGPIIFWRDRRAVADEVALAGTLGRSGWLLAELPKARWYVRERAREAESAEWLLSTWDAAALRLSGVAVASFWDPARAITAHERNSLRHMGVDGRALPPEVRPGTMIGTLLPRVAEELGLPAGVPIVSGVNDGLAAVIGGGLVRPGLAIDVGGTAGGVGIAAAPEEASRIAAVVNGALWSGPAPTPFAPLAILGGAFAGTGRILEWTLETLLAQDLAAQPAQRAALFEAAAALPLRADALLARPADAEVWSRRAHASVQEAFVGTAGHESPMHLVRAAIEAGALAVASLLNTARDAGLPIDEVRLSGPATGASGGPLSGAVNAPDALPQLRADLFDLPVVVTRITEASAAGAAAIAGMGSGDYATLHEAVSALVVPARRFEPVGGATRQAAAALVTRAHATASLRADSRTNEPRSLAPRT